MLKKIITTLTLAVLFLACGSEDSKLNSEGKKIKVVATTTMLADLVEVIAGDKLDIEHLMGPGVDPHLYKASENDISKIATSDILVFNGLHLEGKMGEIFEKMEGRVDIITAEEAIPHELLRILGKGVDPHIWFDTKIWKLVAKNMGNRLMIIDPPNAEFYKANTDNYIIQLDELEAWAKKEISIIPVSERYLVTAHDAFGYFGNRFDFKVVGLQGFSTATEAGVADVRNISQLIYSKKIKAIFIESSVPIRNIEALRASVKAKGGDVVIGGELFSDALGTEGTEEGTYIGMFKHNVETIVNALQ